MYQYSKKKNDKDLRNKLLIAAAIAVLPFLYFAIMGVIDGETITVQDYRLGAFFYDLRQPMRTEIARAITRIGNEGGQALIAVAVTLILVVLKKWRTGLWYGLTVLFGALVLNQAVKYIYKRVRPEDIEHLIEQGGYAFPSGHAMGSMILFGGILFLSIRLLKSTALKWAIGIISGILILFIGLSRIYLGVHYPSDVIGGFSLGFTWLALSIALFGLKITSEEFGRKSRYSYRHYNR